MLTILVRSHRIVRVMLVVYCVEYQKSRRKLLLTFEPLSFFFPPKSCVQLFLSYFQISSQSKNILFSKPCLKPVLTVGCTYPTIKIFHKCLFTSYPRIQRRIIHFASFELTVAK